MDLIRAGNAGVLHAAQNAAYTAASRAASRLFARATHHPYRATGRARSASMRGTKRKRGSGSGSGSRRAKKKPKPTPTSRAAATVTRQHDLKMQYRKRRLSRAAKGYRKWAKKVRKAANGSAKLHFSHIGTATNISATTPAFNDGNIQVVVATNASQPRTDFRLMSMTSYSNMQQLQDSIREVPIGTTSVETENVFVRQQFNSVLGFWAQENMDLSIKNVITQPIMVDIYICRAAQDIADTSHQTAYGSWQTCTTEAQTLNGVNLYGAALREYYSGATPMDAPGFGQYWNVLNKQRIEMEPNEVISTALTCPGRWINYAKWDSKVVKKGITYDIIIVACPTWNEFAAEQLLIEIQWSKVCRLRMPGLFQGTQMQFTGSIAV